MKRTVAALMFEELKEAPGVEKELKKDWLTAVRLSVTNGRLARALQASEAAASTRHPHFRNTQ